MKNIVFVLLLSMLLISSCNDETSHKVQVAKPVKTIDMTGYSEIAPSSPLNLLFIHHSCGGQWLADKGPDNCKDCICKSHPNGGGLRKLLEKNGYRVHEASYNSIIGQKTDIKDWPPKFRDEMDRILRTKMQDELLPEGQINNIVVFKSCFPNNNFPDDQSVKRAKEAYLSLLPFFRKHPEILFVAVSAPPLVRPCSHPLKGLIKKMLGKCKSIDSTGRRAREFNNWLKDIESGWLSKYDLNNVVVFDYYDILTKNGKSNWAEYPTSWTDSHPNSDGNKMATRQFVPFLNKAVRRAGLTK